MSHRLAAAVLGMACAAVAQAQDFERVQVADAFIEMHTFPGRGYPIHHVAARHEWVTIELRHTDWFKVRTDKGIVGWVPRAQLEKTLTADGRPKSFRDVLVDDYLARRVELGANIGRFKGEPMLKFWTAYRASDALGVELAFGQVQGVFSGTDFWHLNLTVEPWSDQRLSPYLAVGLGKFNNIPNASLVDATPVNAKLGNAGIGVRWHITDRFVARADWTLYSAFVADTRSLEYRAVSAGLSFFF